MAINTEPIHLDVRRGTDLHVQRPFAVDDRIVFELRTPAIVESGTTRETQPERVERPLVLTRQEAIAVAHRLLYLANL